MRPGTIDVTGLPEQVVAAIENLVQSVRKNFPDQESETKPGCFIVTLPR